METGTLEPVLHVAAPAVFGGLERVVSALAQGLQARGRPVHVLAILDAGVKSHPLVEELRAAGVPARGIEVRARDYRFERAALARVIEGTGVRIVHTHGARVDVVDGPPARQRGLATVSTLHGFTGGGWKNRVYERLQIRAVRRCDAVIAVSGPMAERLRRSGVPANRLHVVPNAWAPRSEPLPRAAAREALGVAPGGFRIGWVGRLTAEKGPDVFVQALAGLRDLPLAVSVIGAGRLADRLRHVAREAGVGDRVTWHGVVPDADRLMAAFDLLVLSSRTEGTPIVLFEAMAAGIPVVATAVGGVPGVVTDREALVVPADDRVALAAAIRRVVDDPAGARSRAEAAHAVLARRFAVQPWLDAYDRVYSTIERPRRAAGTT